MDRIFTNLNPTAAALLLNLPESAAPGIDTTILHPEFAAPYQANRAKVAAVDVIGQIGDPFSLTDLYSYTMLDGTVYHEFVQAMAIFTDESQALIRFRALKDAAGEVVAASRWSEDDIGRYLEVRGTMYLPATPVEWV